MGEDSIRVIETKLDILINDFQRFKQGQENVNKELSNHSSDESAVQAKILTTLRWHSTIGAGMIAAIGYMYVNLLVRV